MKYSNVFYFRYKQTLKNLILCSFVNYVISIDQRKFKALQNTNCDNIVKIEFISIYFSTEKKSAIGNHKSKKINCIPYYDHCIVESNDQSKSIHHYLYHSDQKQGEPKI